MEAATGKRVILSYEMAIELPGRDRFTWGRESETMSQLTNGMEKTGKTPLTL